MIHGFVRACALSPALRVADCVYNTEQTAAAMRRAAEQDVQLAVFPELGLTGYTCGDLFLQQALQKTAERAIVSLLEVSAELELLTLVGLPVGIDGKLYNCAAVLFRGRLLGLVPKTYIPNYGEFYERRHFTPAPDGLRNAIHEVEKNYETMARRVADINWNSRVETQLKAYTSLLD